MWAGTASNLICSFYGVLNALKASLLLCAWFFFLKKIPISGGRGEVRPCSSLSVGISLTPPGSLWLQPSLLHNQLWLVGERNRCFLGTRFPRQPQTAECSVPERMKLLRWQSNLTLEREARLPLLVSLPF